MIVVYSFEDQYAQMTARLDDPAHQSLLHQLSASSPRFAQLASWQAFAQLIERPAATPEMHNGVLRPLIRMHTRSGDSRTANALTFAFWPRLLSIHRRTHKWEQNHQDLWQNTILSFLETLRLPNLLFAKDIAKRIYFRTRARLHRIYLKEWTQASKLTQVSSHMLANVLHAPEDRFAQIELRDQLRACYAAIRRQRQLGVIDRNELSLIVATRLCGRPLKYAAKRQCLSYDAAKCRRDRAERCLADRGVTLPSLGKQSRGVGGSQSN